MGAAPDLTGTVLDGRYRLIRLMGEGGMGQVYEGLHDTLDRKVAVKILLPRFAYDARFRERFLREAKAASKVRHPNVVQIIDFGETPTGSVYFAMEYLEGRDLRALLHDCGALPWSRARGLLLQITSALAAAHERGVIHRDLKPANFFVSDARGFQDFVKVLDFGIAKIATDGTEESSVASSLTGTGQVFGTAKYMAPEQAYGVSNDPRVDVYSVGVVGYEILTGRIPFDGATAFEIITRHVNEPPTPPRRLQPSIPPAVEAVILKALAKKPTDRHRSMEELEEALSSIPVDVGTRGRLAPGLSPALRNRIEPAGSRRVPVGSPAAAPFPQTQARPAPRAPGARASLDPMPQPGGDGPTTVRPAPVPSSTPAPFPARTPAPAPRTPAPPQGTAPPHAETVVASAPSGPLPIAGLPASGPQPDLAVTTTAASGPQLGPGYSTSASGSQPRPGYSTGGSGPQPDLAHTTAAPPSRPGASGPQPDLAHTTAAPPSRPGASGPQPDPDVTTTAASGPQPSPGSAVPPSAPGSWGRRPAPPGPSGSFPPVPTDTTMVASGYDGGMAPYGGSSPADTSPSGSLSPYPASTSSSGPQPPPGSASGSQPHPARDPSGPMVGDATMVATSSSSATAPIQEVGDPRASTGPLDSFPGTSSAPETDQQLAFPRPGPNRLLIAAVGLVGMVLAFSLVVMAFSDDDEDGPSDAATQASASVTPKASPSDRAEPPDDPRGSSLAVPPSDAPADSGEPDARASDDGRGDTEPSVVDGSNEDDDEEDGVPEDDDPSPGIQPSDSTTTTTATKPRPPPTDAQLRSRLARKMKRKCKALGSGRTVTIDLLVSGDGKVLSKKTPGTSGELAKCLLEQAARAKFNEGSIRTISFELAL